MQQDARDSLPATLSQYHNIDANRYNSTAALSMPPIPTYIMWAQQREILIKRVYNNSCFVNIQLPLRNTQQMSF